MCLQYYNPSIEENKKCQEGFFYLLAANSTLHYFTIMVKQSSTSFEYPSFVKVREIK